MGNTCGGWDAQVDRNAVIKASPNSSKGHIRSINEMGPCKVVLIYRCQAHGKDIEERLCNLWEWSEDQQHRPW